MVFYNFIPRKIESDYFVLGPTYIGHASVFVKPMSHGTKIKLRSLAIPHRRDSWNDGG